jgi:phosphohistidine phosphatase
MRLYVMRHGPAEDRSSTGRDFDRRLTIPGRELVRRVAVAFQKARLAGKDPAGPLRILSSPRARARETAAIVHGVIVPAPRQIELRDALGGEATIPLALAAEATASGEDTLLVGHQPVIEDFVKELLDGAPGFPGFRTATLVGLDRTAGGDGWTLVEHIDPTQLPG